MKSKPCYSVAELLSALETGSMPAGVVQPLPAVSIVWRERAAVEKGKKFMTECIRLRDDDVYVSSSSGYYVVGENESVIFLSKPPGVYFFFLLRAQLPHSTTVSSRWWPVFC